MNNIRIENVSYADVRNGNYPFEINNTILIQIVDPCVEFPTSPISFKETYQFEFSDVQDEDDIVWSFRMSNVQGKEIADILLKAKENKMDIIVHCIAGLCRSGAVAEVGKIIGFESHNHKQPNIHVKQSLMRELGLIPDYYEKD